MGVLGQISGAGNVIVQRLSTEIYGILLNSLSSHYEVPLTNFVVSVSRLNIPSFSKRGRSEKEKR